MIKADPALSSFASGEMSPMLLGRSDIQRWFSAAQRLENFIVRHQGPMVFRTGAGNVGRAVSQAAGKTIVLQDFIFSRTSAVAVEISEAGFRFYRNGALLPTTCTTIYGTAVPIPYSNSEVGELQFAQSADVLFITHPNRPPATLSHYSDTDWRYELIDISYGPFMDQNPGDQNISLHCTTPVDRLDLTSNWTTSGASGLQPEFDAIINLTYVQYNVSGQKVLGIVQNILGGNKIRIFPLEDFCFALSNEVYSPGLYVGWDSTNSVPLYSPITEGPGRTVAFSATAVATQEMIGGYLRFPDQTGKYWWLQITGVGDIVKQGAYGILATGTILTNCPPNHPELNTTTGVYYPVGVITPSNRVCKSQLTASDPNFFNVATDPQSRKFRFVLGGTVVYATGRAADGGDAQPNSGQYLAVFLNRPLPRSPINHLSEVDDGTTNDWNRGAWYVGNWPATVGFHGQRLAFASTLEEPQTGWLSKTSDYFNFATTDEKLKVFDDSAINFTLASDTVNQILWITSKKVLAIGTAGSEWTVSTGAAAEALKPTNVSADSQSAWGSEFLKPILVGNYLIYVQRGANKLRQQSYDANTESHNSLDLTIFSDHILKDHGGCLQLAYHQLPESAIIARMADGQVGFLTYETDQQVYAWSRINLGGPAGVSGFCESLCVIPEGNRSSIYMVVRRTVNGVLTRTIERLRPEFRPTAVDDWASAIFLDNWVDKTGIGYNLTGLLDFANSTVVVMIGAGEFYSGLVSAAGTLTIPASYILTGKQVRVGWAYQGLYQAFPIEIQGAAGTTQGKLKRIDTLVLRLKDTIQFSHGRDGNVKTVRNEVVGTTTFADGDVRVPFDNGIDTRAAFVITQNKPVPLTILSIYPEMAQNQG